MSTDEPCELPALYRELARRIHDVPGVVAVVLGGSRARGLEEPDSDIDIGIYYHSDRPPALNDLRALAHELHCGAEAPTVTGPGDWGAWENGGAWLEVDGFLVDWLYRDLDRVAQVLSDCRYGVVTCDYDVSRPHGFHNHIYLAEVHYCRPLADPSDAIDRLKEQVREYPLALKNTIVERFLFEAEFALDLAGGGERRGDVFHVSGCLFRCAAALVQVLFAVNETWFMGEKAALETIETFPLQPEHFSERVTATLAGIGRQQHELAEALAAMEALIYETRALGRITQSDDSN